MNILITAGPTHEPIDAVRYIGNRSSGKMGAALARAAVHAGHSVKMIVGPVTAALPEVPRLEVQTSDEMLRMVLREFGQHDLLIMAAAVADYQPVKVVAGKMARKGSLSIECQATPDIVAHATDMRRADQRVVGFSLESAGNIDRAWEKLKRKRLNMIVYNSTATMGSDRVEAALLYPDGHAENLPSRSKDEFADILIQRSVALFG